MRTVFKSIIDDRHKNTAKQECQNYENEQDIQKNAKDSIYNIGGSFSFEIFYQIGFKMRP